VADTLHVTRIPQEGPVETWEIPVTRPLTVAECAQAAQDAWRVLDDLAVSQRKTPKEIYRAQDLLRDVILRARAEGLIEPPHCRCGACSYCREVHDV
jgi:hypothetical protein